ncbi:MAG: class IV adenylate cyclase [Bacilli bacterium]|nr:class IV adenylate cyclase [Bacilli bacterium]
MKIKVETEQKYYCFNPEKLIEKINELGFNELNKKSESDEYFTDINSEYIANRTCLRIRKTNNSKMEITFKGKSSSLLGKYCKLENNISADIGEYENFVNLFTSLGFYSYCEVIKERLTFEKYDDKYKYSIMIDSLPNIGGFVEFEILSEQEDSTKDELNIALKKFVNAFVDLNLKEETRPYRDVVADYIYSKNCPKDKLEDIYVNIDEFIVNYEKEFFKKYKDVIAKETNKSIKWGAFRKDKSLNGILINYIDQYLNNLIYDSKELLVAMQLLEMLPQKKHFITKTNEVFFTHFFGMLNIELDDVIFTEEDSLNQVIKRNSIDLKHSMILNKKDLKEINSVLLIIMNNE